MKQTLLRIYTAAILLCVLAMCCVAVQASDSEAECAHTFGEYELTIAPDCTQKGEAVRTCTACGYQQSIVVTRPGHVPGEWVLDVAPQIGTAGSMSRSCTVCGKVLQTEAVAPLPEPTPEPTPETSEIPEESWIDVPLPVALLAFILPNLILVAVLILREIRNRIAKLKL